MKKIVYLLLAIILILVDLFSGCGPSQPSTSLLATPAISSIPPVSGLTPSTTRPSPSITSIIQPSASTANTPSPTNIVAVSPSAPPSTSPSTGSGVLTLTSTDPFTLDPALSDDALSTGDIMQIFSGLTAPWTRTGV